MNFYQQGQETALEKLGMLSALRGAGKGIANLTKETGSSLKDVWGRVGGLKGLGYSLRGGGFQGAREGIGKAWQNLAPEQQAMLKQLGAGAAVGGVGGGVAGGEAGGTGGALLGALGGAGAGAFGGRVLGKHMRGKLPQMIQNTMRARSTAFPRSAAASL